MDQDPTTSKPVVIVTGASSGIGEQAGVTLAKAGYRVVLGARRIGQLEEIADRIRSQGGEALAVELDLSSLEQIKNLIERTHREFGRIDILINNAGSARHLWLDELDPEADIQKLIQVNLAGMIQLTRLVLPDMIAAGRGQIIHVSSIAAWVGIPTYSIYNACKYGSRGFYASLRRELRGRGITVSEIFPGAVDTAFGQDPDLGWKTTTVTPQFALLSSQTVADRILEVIRKKKTSLVIPGFMWLAIWADGVAPRLVSWILSRYFYEEEGERYSWRQRKLK